MNKQVERSHENKVLFPDTGITKGQLIDYYQKVATPLIEHAASRPLSFKRCPDGIADCFFQKHAADYFPDWLEEVDVETEDGAIRQIVINEAADLEFLANQGCIELHGPLAEKDAPGKPDQIVFDLDPANEDDFDIVKRAAGVIRDHLDGIGLNAFLKTTGSAGLHILIPIHPEQGFDDVRDWAQSVAVSLAERHDDWLTTEVRKTKRHGRLFLDTGRTAYGQTAVIAYSVRAIEGAPVATPIQWDELAKLGSAQEYTVENIPRRLGQRDDPWQNLKRHRQHLDPGKIK